MSAAVSARMRMPCGGEGPALLSREPGSHRHGRRAHHVAVVQDTKLYLDPGPSPFAIAHVVSRGFVTKGQSLMVV